jgi:hypothetical protein
MIPLSLLLGLAASLLILRYVWSTWAHARKARNWRCGTLVRFPTDALGIGPLKEALKADKEGTLPLNLLHRVNVLSAREKRHVQTWVIRMVGRDNIFTCDPANIQALLATKFKDFALGPARRDSLHPLLGTGIV